MGTTRAAFRRRSPTRRPADGGLPYIMSAVRMVVSLALVFLAACITFPKSTFFAPTGPGKVLDDYLGAPSLLRIAKAPKSDIVVSVETNDPPRLNIGIHLRGSATFRFDAQAIEVTCMGGTPRSIPFGAIEAAREHGGIGYTGEVPSDAELIPGRHGISDGWSQGYYWVGVSLPACIGQQFSVVIPPFSLATTQYPAATIMFKLRSGRYMHAEQIL